jgi:phage FluMu protein Com
MKHEMITCDNCNKTLDRSKESYFSLDTYKHMHLSYAASKENTIGMNICRTTLDFCSKVCIGVFFSKECDKLLIEAEKNANIR